MTHRVYPLAVDPLAYTNCQASTDEIDNDSQKKARFVQPTHLPSPDTRIASNSTEGQLTASSGVSQPSEKHASSPSVTAGLHSPPSDTQPYSQFLPPPPISYEVEDEEAEGVWGYLVPLDGVSEPLVLRRRAACPVPQTKVGRTDGKSAVSRDEYLNQEESYEKEKAEKGIPAGGYLIGRHPECGQCDSSSRKDARLTANDQIVSSKHPLSVTAIVCCSVKTRTATRLLLSRIFRATAPTSTMLLWVETSDVIFMMAMNCPSWTWLASFSDTPAYATLTASVNNTRFRGSSEKAISRQSTCAPRSAAVLAMPSKSLRSVEQPPTPRLLRRGVELMACSKRLVS